MEFNEVIPFLQENHLAVVTTLSSSGKAQATVVSAGPHEGRMAFVSREDTLKVRHARRGSRCTVTVIRPDTMRYLTVEGPATVHGWDNTRPEVLLPLLRQAYKAVGRDPEGIKDFDRTMQDERRTVVLVTPERVYGSLQTAAQRAAQAE